MPEGATLVRISLSRLTGANARRTRVASVARRTPTAKRYKFRLTEPKLRRLKPGRYLIEVRAGTSRTSLGPPADWTFTIRKGGTSRRS